MRILKNITKKDPHKKMHLPARNRLVRQALNFIIFEKCILQADIYRPTDSIYQNKQTQLYDLWAFQRL